MAFVKIIKNKAYSKRMQVKPKRRRQSKTDYYARRRLVFQEKNKYDSKKYRLVVRRTNARILTQVIYSNMTGDRVLCAAESDELKTKGLTAGISNYAGAYCTGLLLARRLLKQVGLADMYKGQENIDGQYYNSFEHCEDKRPFKALLDVGLARTTTGARIFGALKGACDGGINVPHSDKRFPGYTRAKVEQITNKRGKSIDTEKTEAKFDSKVHRARIMGTHVTTYMNQMKKEDPDKFNRHFSNWKKCLDACKAKTCEDVYKKVHAAIRKDPTRVKREGNKKPTRTVVEKGFALVQKDSKNRKWLRNKRINAETRKANIQQKFANAMAQNQ